MIRLTALLLTVLTGFTGLVYEVAWQKYLATLLGSHGEATEAVLAIFLGELSTGYELFGRATRALVARPRLLASYALVEGGIGVYALLFPFLFSAAQYVSLLSPLDLDALGFAFDVALSALLIGPPAVLMGATIPILTLALAGDLQHATRVHAWVYGFNTLGAFAGALAGGFWLVPQLGLDGVVWTMGGINLAAAAVFALLERRASTVAPDLAEPCADEPVAHFATWAGIALLAGFAMMAFQTTLNRIGALAMGSSQFTFAMVVAVFVLCLALGSLAVSALPRIPRTLVVGSQWALVALLFPLYLAASDAPYWVHWIRVGFDAISHDAFFAYQRAVFLATLAVLAIPIGLSGALLPLLFHQLRRQVRDLGAVAGRLYAWNTVGSLLGALLGGYLLLVWIDLHHVYRIAMTCLAVGATLLTLLVLDRLPRAVPAIALLATLVAIALLPPWSADRLTAGLFRTRKATSVTHKGPDKFFERPRRPEVIFYDDDPIATVSVGKPQRRPENLALSVNGKPDGSLIGDRTTMVLSGLVPALMAERHQRCFVIGLGTGMTAGELGALDATREVEVAEISRGVIAASPLFDEGNQGVSKNTKIRISRGDAYRSLLRSSGRYDVIMSEPSNPWVAGVEMLYSREFLEAARARLAPGGVYAQWFHVYESDEEVVSLVLRTYASVFPHVSVWFTDGPDLLLLGFDRPERALDVRALEARFEQRDFAAGFARLGIESFPQLLAHELIPLGTLHAEPLDGPLQTLRRPILSDWAARAFFRGADAWLAPFPSDRHREVSVRNSLLRRYAGGGDALPEGIFEIAVRETCRLSRDVECATFFARWALDHPGSHRRRTTLTELRMKGGAKKNVHIEAPRLRELYALFSGTIRPESGPLTSRAALLTSTRFLNYYHHAVPFHRRVLEEVWNRCEGESCAPARSEIEAYLWGLGAGAQSGAGEGASTQPSSASAPADDSST
jgi:predicted membrane-bound spermidine synthase